MRTYADLWNDNLEASGQSRPSNPVRLTISKGDYVWDAQLGRFRYQEKWEEEHLMEDEELHHQTPLATPSPISDNGSRDPSPPLIPALQPSTLHGHLEGRSHQPSLWVLDTNTLMSCLDLLKALFAALLTRNLAYAMSMSSQTQQSHGPAAPAPIKLVIPYVVISELDGLKVTRRKEDGTGRPVAQQAREANHWLLSALQKQKRVPIDQAGSHLPEDLWPLFSQPSTHYARSKRGASSSSRFTFDDSLSPDDEIIKFCADLKAQTPSNVSFCSDDINARTKAELDNIDSLGMRELASALQRSFKEVHSSERKWTLVADALIEQWEYQAGIDVQRHCPEEQTQHGVNGDLAFLQHEQHMPSLQKGQMLSPMTANEMMEVDMALEEQQPTPAPRTSPTPIPLTSSSSQRMSRPAGLSDEGRRTNDSIHNPQNSHRSYLSPTHTQQPFKSASPSAAAAAGQPPQAELDDLNPQIDWQDLIKQSGFSSRTPTRQRNGKW